MSSFPLAPAFLTSVLVHLSMLMSLSLLWGSLHMVPSRSELIPAEVVISTPPPAPEPVATPELEPLTPPTILTKTDVTLAQPPPTPPPAPLTPSKMEPVTPPKAIEKVLPKRAEPRPKPLPAVKRPPSPADQLPAGPPPGPETKTFEKPKPGPLTPMPDEGPAPTGANTLGPSTVNNPVNQPAKSIEGGEAGAGELSERGDLPVVPGAGAAAPGAPGLAGGPRAAVGVWVVCDLGPAATDLGEASAASPAHWQAISCCPGIRIPHGARASQVPPPSCLRYSRMAGWEKSRLNARLGIQISIRRPWRLSRSDALNRPGAAINPLPYGSECQ